mmetsp:Transcript_46747/g.144186  ORF Transcript_46747/g.144186 Transcript_46747/m.144186 type:complete len:221 (-) Transcript_46747:973-1635(-)
MLLLLPQLLPDRGDRRALVFLRGRVDEHGVDKAALVPEVARPVKVVVRAVAQRPPRRRERLRLQQRVWLVRLRGDLGVGRRDQQRLAGRVPLIAHLLERPPRVVDMDWVLARRRRVRVHELAPIAHRARALRVGRFRVVIVTKDEARDVEVGRRQVADRGSRKVQDPIETWRVHLHFALAGSTRRGRRRGRLLAVVAVRRLIQDWRRRLRRRAARSVPAR